MQKKLLRYLSALASVFLFGCTSSVAREPTPVLDGATGERMALIRRAQSFERELGWWETKNFRVYSDEWNAYKHCTHTKEFSFKLRYFPYGESCEILEGEKDTFEYDAEALATIKTPLLPSLVRAPLPRFLSVVFHEDFHEQMLGMPTRELDESATTLMGLLATRDFARREYGEDSSLVQVLARDVDAHLASSHMLLRYHAQLQMLYDDVDAGKTSIGEARSEKARLYAAMHKDCAGIQMTTIKPCAHVRNNAQMSFQIPYSRHYPMFYELYIACAKDTRRTGDIIMRHADARVDEAEYIRRIERHITYGCTD